MLYQHAQMVLICFPESQEYQTIYNSAYKIIEQHSVILSNFTPNPSENICTPVPLEIETKRCLASPVDGGNNFNPSKRYPGSTCGNLPRLIILITLVGYMFGRLQTIMDGHSSKTILHYRLAVQFPCICPLDFAALRTLPPRTELETCCTKLEKPELETLT